MLETIINELKRKGYSNATAVYYGKQLFNELYGRDKDKYTREEKVWAEKLGFLAEEVRVLQLNEENYKNYISGRDYHLLDPIDPFTKRLVDGKLVIPYTIGGRFPQYLPKYYCWIMDENTLVPMNDNMIYNYEGVEDYLKKLLDVVGCLAIKPYTGAGGIGFLKLEKKGNQYYANNDLVSDFAEVTRLISDKYLVTEYVRQCREFDEVWGDSAATLRVISINKEGKPHTFVSYVRFGTEISKGACNLTSGGVAVPFDWETGAYYPKMYRYIDYCDDGKYIIDKHPDSGVSLAGKMVPHFEQVKQLVNDICGFMSVHTYFGFDIMITDDGVKICEINSHPSLDYEQLMFGGIWTQDEIVTSFFADLLNRKLN